MICGRLRPPCVRDLFMSEVPSPSRSPAWIFNAWIARQDVKCVICGEVCISPIPEQLRDAIECYDFGDGFPEDLELVCFYCDRCHVCLSRRMFDLHLRLSLVCQQNRVEYIPGSQCSVHVPLVCAVDYELLPVLHGDWYAARFAHQTADPLFLGIVIGIHIQYGAGIDDHRWRRQSQQAGEGLLDTAPPLRQPEPPLSPTPPCSPPNPNAFNPNAH